MWPACREWPLFIPLALHKSRNSPRQSRSTPIDNRLFLSLPFQSLLATVRLRRSQRLAPESRLSNPRPHRPRHLQLSYSSRRLRYGGVRSTGARSRLETKEQRPVDDNELYEKIPVETSYHQLRNAQDNRVGRHTVWSGRIRLLSNWRNLRFVRRSDGREDGDVEGYEGGFVQLGGGAVDAGGEGDDSETSVA